jgi:hypothetical protein
MDQFQLYLSMPKYLVALICSALDSGIIFVSIPALSALQQFFANSKSLYIQNQQMDRCSGLAG